MRAVILQPSYIPWRGYFDLIRKADVFVFYDDVQYDTRGWRNRNRIKTPNGTSWLTIPVLKHGAQTNSIPINAIATADDSWPRAHLSALNAAYSSAPHYAECRAWLEEMYRRPSRLLADFTIGSTIEIASRLGITDTRYVRSSEIAAEGRKTDRLVSILRELGATRYLSGPSAKDYIEPEKFDEAGIELEWMEYQYPTYPQLHPPFDPFVTVLDLLFMMNGEAASKIWPTG